MVLGILTAIAACPAIIGTTEAVRQGQRQSAREKHRGLKTNLSVVCSRASKGGREIDGCEVVLSEDKVRNHFPPSVLPRPVRRILEIDRVIPAVHQCTIGRIPGWASGGPPIRRLLPALS
jgi:hypothetical protein